MSGHTSNKVFNSYYDIEPQDLWKNNNEMYFGFDLSDKPKKVKTTIVLDEQIEENLKNLQNWFLKGYINEEEYDLKKKDILNL